MSYFMAPTVDNPFAMGTGLGAHQAAAGVHFRRSDDATSSILRDSFKLENFISINEFIICYLFTYGNTRSSKLRLRSPMTNVNTNANHEEKENIELHP